jgi:hypothetical protein
MWRDWSAVRVAARKISAAIITDAANGDAILKQAGARPEALKPRHFISALLPRIIGHEMIEKWKLGVA